MITRASITVHETLTRCAVGMHILTFVLDVNFSLVMLHRHHVYVI
jgi:hypothetical protein